jgi:hypothetical protein
MYNPAIHTATNKPIGLTGKPVDARTYYYDAVNYVYRAYVSTAEVKAYLIGTDRVGQFSIIINTGGSLSGGVITGGTNLEWWFKDGVLDANLVLKGSGGASVTPIEHDVTAGDSQPVTIPYTAWVWPTVLFRDSSGNKYGGALDQDTGTSIIVTGDGGTTFADSFKIIVKP